MRGQVDVRVKAWVNACINCQALVPNPVPLDLIPISNPKPKKVKNPKSYGTGGDTIITWATNIAACSFQHSRLLHPTHNF